MPKSKDQMEIIEDASIHNLCDWLGISSEDTWNDKKWFHCIINPTRGEPDVYVSYENGVMTIGRFKK